MINSVCIDILTLFPDMFAGPFNESIIGRAVERGLVHISIHNLRDYTHDRHHTVDDCPYGGGVGMILKPEPLFEAVESIKSAVIQRGEATPRVVLLTPQGGLFCQHIAAEMANLKALLLICGHYEGIDERVREHLIDDEISIGDYVLTGGELAAMVVVDAIVRLLPGVLGADSALNEDSHTNGLLEYPQYTRPREYRGWEVPPILLSGNHAEIARWRGEQSLSRTRQRRPDLLARDSDTKAKREN